jgi:hypothetical protein
MNRRVLSRIISAVLLGMLFGAYMHHDYVRANKRGREAYLKHQEHRYDTYMANPTPFSKSALEGVIAIALFVGFYEGLALTFSMLLKDAMPDPKRATQNMHLDSSPDAH